MMLENSQFKPYLGIRVRTVVMKYWYSLLFYKNLSAQKSPATSFELSSVNSILQIFYIATNHSNIFVMQLIMEPFHKWFQNA